MVFCGQDGQRAPRRRTDIISIDKVLKNLKSPPVRLLLCEFEEQISFLHLKRAS